MPSSAGSVNINLSMNAVTFTQGIKNAQAELDKFAGKSKQAGHSTVSSMQAASGAIRELEGNFTNNVRAVERFITTIPGVGNALKAAFPLIGGLAFGAMIGEQITKIATFIKTANEMPRAITQGFAALSLASKTSTDQLQLTNDTLQNSINRLEHKPENNLKIVMDEARLAADKLAGSIEKSNAAVNDLLSKNHLSGWALLLGKQGTADREGTAKAFGRQADSNAYDLANATTPEQTAAAQKALKATQDAQLAEARTDLAKRLSQANSSDHLDNGANIAIDKGVITAILNQQKQSAAELQNADLEARNKKLEGDKAARMAAQEAQKKADAEALKELQAAHLAWDAEETRSQGDEVTYWANRIASLTAGSAAYRESQKKSNEAIVALNRSNSEAITKFTTEYMNDFQKSSGLSGQDSKNLNHQGGSANDYIQSLRQSIDLNKQNSSAIAENSIQMAYATGQMTRLNAAQALANLHTQDYADALSKLKDQREAISSSIEYNSNPLGRKAALQNNQNQQDALNSSRTIQVGQDSLGTNTSGTSGFVGAKDALDEFVIASRDAASQMRDLTSNILGGLNQQIVGAMSGQKTNFGNFGAGVFRSVANTGLQKAEGSVLSTFGFGSGAKLGTKGNPMYVISAGISSAVSGAASAIGKVTGGSGGFGSSIMGALKGVIPFLADGGPINGPAIVGEQGPELFNPGTSGTITPNHKLVSSGSGDIHFHPGAIDARGSNDPAQVEAAVQRGIAKAAPHIMAGSVQAMQEHNKRRSPGR
ncbi:phage tail tape measure C-terminal domain-containing protein [Granulicella sp. dw_53]|uniref:phage tail tape measure C-terminal domain-containing protein n=1 Tax=Granulicella sp. dw_53 TaxID=2719792 RepID=UPI001BD34292|nr:phage tail tape measure C-terminal domain-containing protein [Granulicella sp. dw_53]